MKCCCFLYWGYQLCYLSHCLKKKKKKKTHTETSEQILRFKLKSSVLMPTVLILTDVARRNVVSLSYVIHPSVGSVLLVVQVRLTSLCVWFILLEPAWVRKTSPHLLGLKKTSKSKQLNSWKLWDSEVLTYELITKFVFDQLFTHTYVLFSCKLSLRTMLEVLCSVTTHQP